jgi:predicted phosphodiesterase
MQCQYCDSENVNFNGYNKTRDRHRVFCKDCGHEFSIPINDVDELPDGEIIENLIEPKHEQVQNDFNNRFVEIVGFYQLYGKEKTLSIYNIKEETLDKYIRNVKNAYGKSDLDKNVILKKIAEIYTDKELSAIANGGRILPGKDRVPVVDFEGERVRIGAMTDTHFGSIYTDVNYVYQAFEEFKKEGVDFVTHSGDVTEGMSNRAGQVYELSHIGYTSQKKHAIDVLSQCPAPLYLIDGNHDRWHLKANGAYIVEDIASAIGATYLGADEGDISLKGKATLKLWHGEDGNSYAYSYRLQKIIESYTGGEKPNVLFVGHTHKSLYIFERFIHCYSLGSMQKQSKWMRSGRIAAHVGFWIIDIYVGKKGVNKCTGTWYPFYA